MAAGALLLGQVGDEAFGGQHEAGDGGGVLQSGTGHLGGVHHTGNEEVLVLIGHNVVAHGGSFEVLHLLHDEGSFAAGVGHQLAEGSLHSAVHDGSASGFIAGEVETAHGLLGADEGHTTAGNDTFLHSSTGGVQSVVHAVLLLLHLGFSSSTHLDDGHTAGELGEALLELLAVIVGSGLLNLVTDLGHAGGDIGRLAGAFDDDGGVLGDNHALGKAEHVHIHILELEAEVLGDALTTGKDGDILEHGLAAVAEAGSLHSGHIQGAAQAVHHEGCQSLTLHVLSDDEEGLAALGHLLQNGEEILQVANLLLEDKDVGVLQHRLHGICVGHEVGGEVALVELHTFHHVQRGVDTLGFFHGDGAVLAYLVHSLGDNVTDFGVPVGGYGSHLSNLLGGIHGLGDVLELAHDSGGGLVDATLQGDGVSTGGHVAQTFAVDSLSQHGGGGGAVAGDVVGLAGNLAHQLGAHVLVSVLELDFLSHGHTVLGDVGGTELLVNDNVAASRAQGALHSLGNLGYTGQQALACGFVKRKLLCHNWNDL